MDTMCRACVAKEGDFFKMDAACLLNYNTLTSLGVKLDDSLPQYLCQKCWDTVEFCVEFRTKCIATESALLSMASSKMVIKSEKDVKVEENSQIKVEDRRGIKQDEEHLFDDVEDDNDNYQVQLIYETTEVSKLIKNVDEGRTRTSSRLKRKISKEIITEKIKAKVKKTKHTSKVGNTKQNEKNKLLCGLCKNTYEDRSSLQSHLEKHMRGTECSLCDFSYSEWTQLIAHRIRHVPGDQKKCHICWKNFRADYTLEFHYMTEHSDKEFTGLPCKVCNYKTETPMKLRKHIWFNHSDLQHECAVCKKMYRTRYALKSHTRLHSDYKQFTCELCGFSCKYGGGMIDHQMRKHAEEKYSCKKCKRLFRDQQLLDNHVCLCRSSVLCPDCGKSFPSSNQLSAHLRSVHTSERTYKCDRCAANFKNKQSLRVHMNHHEGNRTEQCEFCPLKFYTRGVLIKHRRIHTGEKPYVCTVCKKGFTGNHNLKVHMKVHGLDLIVKKTAIKDEGDTSIFVNKNVKY